MSIYNVIEYSNNYSKTSGSLCQHNSDEPALKDPGAVNDFPDAKNNRALFNFKQNIKKAQTENRKWWN